VRRAAAACLAVACVAGCGGEGSAPRDAALPDAALPDAAPPDAVPTGRTLGQSCVPDVANPQSNCAAGFICLDLDGTSGPFCTVVCVPGQTDPCPDLTSYTGPGAARCLILVPDANMQPLFNTCAAVCQDAAGDPEICMAGDECNGDCPGHQICNGQLSNGGGVVATICI